MQAENSKNDAGPAILIVDDDPAQRSLLDSFLASQGFQTIVVPSGEKALEVLRSQTVDMMISDVRMPGLSGLETLRRARQIRGAFPFSLSPPMPTSATPSSPCAMALSIIFPSRLTSTNCFPRPPGRRPFPDRPGQFSEAKETPAQYLAVSPLMQALFRDCALIAASESRVLITGESGVGKEAVADVIHAWSPRAAGPLVKVNCAAIPETLLESELFGHEKGAFTGAIAQRIGRFEQAEGGTIFLDEIAEMTPPLQAKLLRVTQGGRFQRIGGNTEIRVNARILAATNRNLEQEVKAGRFREDLFFRLNVVELNVPPLRERREDILPLAHKFIAEFIQGAPAFGRRRGLPGPIFLARKHPRTAQRHGTGRPALPRRTDPARASACEDSPGGRPPITPRRPATRNSSKKSNTRPSCKRLRKHDFNRTATAKALGISRRALIYKLQRMRERGFDVDRAAL